MLNWNYDQLIVAQVALSNLIDNIRKAEKSDTPFTPQAREDIAKIRGTAELLLDDCERITRQPTPDVTQDDITKMFTKES